MEKNQNENNDVVANQEAASAIAHLREIANDDDVPDWLRVSMNAVIDRMEITYSLLDDMQDQIESDCDLFARLASTHLRRN